MIDLVYIHVEYTSVVKYNYCLRIKIATSAIEENRTLPLSLLSVGKGDDGVDRRVESVSCLPSVSLPATCNLDEDESARAATSSEMSKTGETRDRS